ncbi:response regulator transcription factor [Paenibacillus endoradicis]|uniref:response regulator transcription factor n=1 Tax=Paenibacillus endoradicis TaxID=2972487 RepID=UPI0021591236|nr:response regulator transcription factor [Paenibacillus endoradicis]MCR8659626.1 response regulator transcription factor [Paenibacillus endoradicis]
MSVPTILIAEDDQEIAQLVAIHLQHEGYKTIFAYDGQAALDIVMSQQIDLIILDIMMPLLDGLEATRKIREKYSMPIIFLSAKTSDMDKITGLIMGADDYMTKPFNPMELVARVKAQLRRYTLLNQSLSVKESQLIIQGGLQIDPSSHIVTLYDQVIELTPKEFEILYLLAQTPKKVFSTENIFVQVWGESYQDSANTVMVHIRTLRKKLGKDKDQWIKTIWGVGYTFNG